MSDNAAEATNALHNGDCLDVLATLPAESVDVAIEDPPAGIAFMGRTWDNLARYEPRTEFGASIRANLQALGLAKWEVGFVVFMVEVHVAKLRVLKPGAIVASWALPKTSHLAALALRIAGYEVLDFVTHLFGQGMAKAGDLGKKIDKALGAEREVVGTKLGRPGMAKDGSNQRVGYDAMFAGEASGPASLDVIAPATPEAERWTDWSTQLAPGCEFWILARKPTKLTTVQQVLTHGCGALNIGACRVPRGDADRERIETAVSQGAGIFASEHTYGDGGRVAYALPGGGSWPKNVVLTEGGDDCPVAEIDRQGVERGVHSAGARQEPSGFKPASEEKITTNSPAADHVKPRRHGDDGGPSRFFNRFRIAYYAKASDRSVPGSDDPKANRHETHKHPELMRWLVRLLARPGNVVLDCFMGSGTTGVACAAEGISFIGIEREPRHFAVAQARIEHAYRTMAVQLDLFAR